MKFKFVPSVGHPNHLKDIIFRLEACANGLFMDSADKTVPVEKVSGTLYTATNDKGFFVRYVGPDIDAYNPVQIHEGVV